MIVMGIDPGPVMSAYCIIDKFGRPIEADKVANATLRMMLMHGSVKPDRLAIESMVTFSDRAHVGQETFDACIWIGRFLEVWEQYRSSAPVLLLRTVAVRKHICGNHQARDSLVRAAIIDRFGGNDRVAKGTKKAPGPLYGFAADKWNALAIAITAKETGA